MSSIIRNELKWVTAFLSNRTFQVHLNNTLSDSRLVASGVPQGSILSPVLLLIYIPNFSYVQSPHAVHADDLKISDNPLTKYNQLQSDLH